MYGTICPRCKGQNVPLDEIIFRSDRDDLDRARESAPLASHAKSNYGRAVRAAAWMDTQSEVEETAGRRPTGSVLCGKGGVEARTTA